MLLVLKQKFAENTPKNQAKLVFRGALTFNNKTKEKYVF